MQRGYTTPTHPVMRLAGYANGAGPQGQYPGPYAIFVPTGEYREGVPVPNPGKVPPSAGHWRTSATAKPAQRPRTNPRPTGGKVANRGNPGNPKAKRPRKPARVSNTTLHAQWAKGEF